MFIEYILIGMVLALCSVSGITDILNGKVYNRVLKGFLIASTVIVIIYYMERGILFWPWIVNLLSCVFVSWMLYYLKIWGAGDAKLWMVITFLFPFSVYSRRDYEIFPCFRILMVTFVVAYIYVIAETLIKIIRNGKWPAREKVAFYRRIKIDNVAEFFFLYFVMGAYYFLAEYFFEQYYRSNQIFFVIIGMMFVNKLLECKVDKKFKIVVSLLSFICIYILHGYGINLINQVLIFLIIIISIYIKYTASYFNYEEIRTLDVREGMVLSYGAVLSFRNSRVKGLPTFTDETTRCRINLEESDAVVRWGKSKNGGDMIVIVKQMPFAVFFLVGIVGYLLLFCLELLL